MSTPVMAVARLVLLGGARLRGWLGRLPASPLVTVAVCGLLLAPHAFRGVTDNKDRAVKQGGPWLFSGDEPHYMVLISSVVKDCDLNLSNNYDAVHRGGLDAGRRWAQVRMLDNHSCFLHQGRQIPWAAVYDPITPPERWLPDERGYLLPPKHKGAPDVPQGTPEYSSHQPGLAILLAPVLYPFRDSKYLESAALVCSGLAAVGGLLFFLQLLRGLGADPAMANVAGAVTFLATPVWFYGRSLFMESFLLLFTVGAYSLALVRCRALLPGLLLALAIQVKAYAAVLAVPLFLDYVARGRFRQSVLFALPLAASVGLYLFQNKLFYGGYLNTPQPFVVGPLREGALGQLLSPRFGLFTIVPVALAALACWPKFVAQMPRPAAVLGAGALLLFLLLSKWVGWNGMAFGPRYLVPVLPLVFAALVVAGPKLAVPLLGARLTLALAVVSSLITAEAVFHYSRYWMVNPALELAGYLREFKLTWPTP